MVGHDESALTRPAESAGVLPAAEFVAVLARRKWTIASVFVLVTAVVAAVALRTPPVYEAESSLVVRIGREYVYRPEVGRTDTARMPSLSEMVNSEVEILSSRELARQVVAELGAGKLYPELLEVPDAGKAVEVAVLRFRRSSSIRPVLESSVIKVGFEHESPEIAAEAVNLLVERFKDKHVEVFGEERSGRLEDHLAAKRAELARAEEALADFKRVNGVFDLDQQRSLLLAQRVRLADEQRACELELLDLRLRCAASGQAEPAASVLLPSFLRPEMKPELLRQLHEIEREMRALDPPPADRLMEEAALRLLDLELEESALLRDYSPENRQVQGVRAELSLVRDFLRQAEARAGAFDEARRAERASRRAELQERIGELTADIELLVREEERRAQEELRQGLKSQEIRREELGRRLGELDQQIQVLDQQEKTLRQLERDRVAAESAVQINREKVEEARITEELDRERRINVREIEKAAAPVAPVGLSPGLKVALGAFVGLLAGTAMAFLQDLFRPR